MVNFLGGAGVTIGVIIFIVVVTVGVVSVTGEGATIRDRIFSSSALSPLLIVHYFLPYALIVMVFFMDLMSQLPQAIFGLAFAVVAMFINYAVGRDTTILPNDLCEIPGLKGLASYLMPQSLLFVTTIVTYLASFVTSTISKSPPGVVVSGQTVALQSVSPSPTARTGASWGLALAVIIFQTIGLSTTPGCTMNMKYGVWSIVFAILAGMAIGGGAGYGMSTVSWTQPSYSTPTSITGATFVKESFQLGAGLGEIPNPPSTSQEQAPVDIAKSSGAVTPGESSDQFVCEAYKNGQLVTSTLVG